MPCLSPPPPPCAGEYVVFRDREIALTAAQRDQLRDFVAEHRRYTVWLETGFVVNLFDNQNSRQLPQLPWSDRVTLAEARVGAVREGLMAAGLPADQVRTVQPAINATEYGDDDVTLGPGSGVVSLSCTE